MKYIFSQKERFVFAMPLGELFEIITIAVLFLFVFPVMFILTVAILLNPYLALEIRIAQAAVTMLVSGALLYGSVTYFIRRMKRQLGVHLKKE
ncbi:MAG: hypothetical protein ACW98J_06445 [Candidatus Thorarchaeota archaeon]|jgi:hypothetical protein